MAIFVQPKSRKEAFVRVFIWGGRISGVIRPPQIVDTHSLYDRAKHNLCIGQSGNCRFGCGAQFLTTGFPVVKKKPTD